MAAGVETIVTLLHFTHMTCKPLHVLTALDYKTTRSVAKLHVVSVNEMLEVDQA